MDLANWHSVMESVRQYSDVTYLSKYKKKNVTNAFEMEEKILQLNITDNHISAVLLLILTVRY